MIVDQDIAVANDRFGARKRVVWYNRGFRGGGSAKSGFGKFEFNLKAASIYTKNHRSRNPRECEHFM